MIYYKKIVILMNIALSIVIDNIFDKYKSLTNINP
jgi:phage-related holin